MHDAKLIHEELCAIARTRLELHAREARLLVLAEELEIWRAYGCSSLLDYLDRFCDLHPRTGREYVRVARALSVLPNMREALDARRINYSTARELTRVATPEKEVDWLRTVEGMSAREVEEEVAGRKHGDGPDDPKDPNHRTKIILDVCEPTYAAFMEARSRLRDEHGERLSDDAVALMMCAMVAGDADADGVTGDEHEDTDDDHQDTGDEDRELGMVDDADDTATTTRPGVPPPHQLSITTCRSCAKSFLLAAGRQVAIPPAMLAAAQCDAIHIGDLESDAPQRAVSSVTPRIRRQVLTRDGYRCTVPGCRSKRFLQLHHIVPQSAGGEHKPSNVTTACFAHHLNALHDGKLVVTGTAPHALLWTWPDDPARTTRLTLRRVQRDVGAAHVGHAEAAAVARDHGTRSNVRDEEAWLQSDPRAGDADEVRSDGDAAREPKG